jgi:hypothetical protein
LFTSIKDVTKKEVSAFKYQDIFKQYVTLMFVAMVIAIMPLSVIMAIFFPMITVMIVVAIAYYSLAATAFVTGICVSYFSMVFPWISPVHYNFIAMVPVEVAVPWRQGAAMYPRIILVINILMGVNIVIRINIGHVIITGVMVPYRAPLWLIVYVYTYPESNLRIGYFE